VVMISIAMITTVTNNKLGGVQGRRSPDHRG
jgi:hypothetical protein